LSSPRIPSVLLALGRLCVVSTHQDGIFALLIDATRLQI
jgi:hypothetical protein